eukprot:scaffold2936_cov376-Prasinococcus_capsulatus_cf.AAC.1
MKESTSREQGPSATAATSGAGAAALAGAPLQRRGRGTRARTDERGEAAVPRWGSCRRLWRSRMSLRALHGHRDISIRQGRGPLLSHTGRKGTSQCTSCPRHPDHAGTPLRRVRLSLRSLEALFAAAPGPHLQIQRLSAQRAGAEEVWANED